MFLYGLPIKKDGEYYFTGDIIPDGAEEIEQPTQEILQRAEKLKGRTYSKSEFKNMLFNPTKEEILEERIDELEFYILMQEGVL